MMKRLYRIDYNRNLQDGTYFHNSGIVSVIAPKHHELFVEQYAYEHFGNRIGFVMGAVTSSAITTLWQIREVWEETPSADVPLLTTIEDKVIQDSYDDVQRRKDQNRFRKALQFAETYGIDARLNTEGMPPLRQMTDQEFEEYLHGKPQNDSTDILSEEGIELFKEKLKEGMSPMIPRYLLEDMFPKKSFNLHRDDDDQSRINSLIKYQDKMKEGKG